MEKINLARNIAYQHRFFSLLSTPVTSHWTLSLKGKSQEINTVFPSHICQDPVHSTVEQFHIWTRIRRVVEFEIDSSE
jgi:hypothetical protein